MKEFLYGIVAIIAEIHTYLMQLNDDYEFYFNDSHMETLQTQCCNNIYENRKIHEQPLLGSQVKISI